MVQQLRIIVSGKVQGVGFRYFTQMKANTYGITGWVRNQPNGNVEIIAEGNKDDLALFLASIKEGNPFSRVSHMEIEEVNEISGFTSFTIKY
ncbi:acylphosphatase [Bacillus methanolicus MGA3]|uniref:Acylphosphatase n=1 Tax=Bacillus methanolicus (strain MGA3 / ATCC 53907) TaxID=796606 RepID=I3E2V1_BACMM|nr:acylphosphatase [Bacillus methanolicus MGA3]EIJ80822.1 acylphosphatase [Bacillus methanolicus MGA3]UQD51167.1 acylphosphatase [Bacillus methanolicus]